MYIKFGGGENYRRVVLIWALRVINLLTLSTQISFLIRLNVKDPYRLSLGFKLLAVRRFSLIGIPNLDIGSEGNTALLPNRQIPSHRKSIGDWSLDYRLEQLGLKP
ncbi:MAG: hypothetical protein LBP51_05755 [Deferribacteraceae bacterium]|jgi:hypothetical protein|nr:hypothetical protein [Deferribacteraceae bacterium]